MSYKLQSFDAISDPNSLATSQDGLYTTSNSSRKSGCYVSAKTGFILTFLAMATAAMVGVIVTFAVPRTNDQNDCNCGATQAPVMGNPDCTTPGIPTTQTPQSTTTCPACPDCTVPTTHSPEMSTKTTMELTTHSPDMTSVTTPEITPSPEMAKNYRLPTSLLPIHYNVVLRPDLYNKNPADFSTPGRVKIWINCTEETGNITLHINKMTFDNSTVKVNDMNGNLVTVSMVTENKELHFLIVHVTPNLMAGQIYTFEMSFTAELTDDLSGLYYSQFDRNGTTKYLAITQFQATHARESFPCFDEPALKATFNITLERRNDTPEYRDYISLSNMPLIDSYSTDDGFIADVFAETVVMPTYLLAFAVCDFKYLPNVTANWTMNTYASNEEYNKTEFALEVGVDILRGFEDFFEIPFVLPKLDMIAIPDFGAGAMENWGLITYRTQYMLYDPNVTTAGTQRFVAVIVAHELAHMWFGNLISPQWWDDLWLNEGFASFFEYIGVNFTRPEWNIMDAFAIENMHPAFGVDSYPSSRPIFATNVNSPDDIDRLFDTITYQKGASVIRMMWNFLGPETLRKGLSTYIKRKEYGNVRHQELWQALKEQASLESKSIDVQDIMDTWILQQNYPVVKVTFNNNQIRAEQSRYVIGNASDGAPSPYNFRWTIPFTFTSSSNILYEDNDIHWIYRNQSAASFDWTNTINTANGDWVLANVQQYGYYRVNYDESNWRALIRQLNNNYTRIHPSNRAQIITDLMALVSLDALNITLALSSLDYLDQETEYVPWYAALGEIGYIRNMLLTKPIFGKFEVYMRSKLETIFGKIGFNGNVDETMNDRLLRSYIVGGACYYYNQNCTNQAVRLFNNWLDDETQLIPPDVKSRVMCTGIRESRSDTWDRLFARMASQTPSDQAIIISALGCSREHWVLERYMSYAFDDTKIRRQDARNAVLAVIYNPLGRDLAWNYLQRNWNHITAVYRMSGGNINRILRGLASRLTTQYQRDELASLRGSLEVDSPYITFFDNALQDVDLNVNWVDKHYSELEAWLS
ncbi:aminopeptidase N-like [Saccostrea echinata]|uniref:aminopeptidase N-like n=1 Tax=Saccostrea echinata TaxID=191078 RepID=UPI002A7FEB81|nr:aminopeptidase N-like [Saccostrea echinata]